MPHTSWRDPIGGLAGALEPQTDPMLHHMLRQVTTASSQHVTILELVASFLPAAERLGLFDVWLEPQRHALSVYQSHAHAFCVHSPVMKILSSDLKVCPNRARANHLWAAQRPMSAPDFLPEDVDRYWWFFLSPQVHLLKIQGTAGFWRPLQHQATIPTPSDVKRWCEAMNMRHGPEVIQPELFCRLSREDQIKFRRAVDMCTELDRVHRSALWCSVAPFLSLGPKAGTLAGVQLPRTMTTQQQSQDEVRRQQEVDMELRVRQMWETGTRQRKEAL